MTMKSIWAVLAVLFLAGGAALAEEPVFPLSCIPGQTCWIIGYPDLNATPGVAQDYACGPGADDGDVFLHLAIKDVSKIPMNIAVFAINDGVVKDASDGLDDLVAESKRALPRGISNCGNGILIDHGGGVRSAYCHLKKGSIAVKPGQKVQRGDIIGAAGQSGVALWPQLAFSIRKGGFFVDPITGMTTAEGCGQKPDPQVATPAQFLEYQPAAITTLGFSNAEMSEGLMALGKAPIFTQLSREEPAINLYGMIVGLRARDRVEIRIRDPRGRTFFTESYTAQEDTLRAPINAGRQRGYIGWRQGMYTGEVSVTRSIQQKDYVVSRAVTVKVE